MKHIITKLFTRVAMIAVLLTTAFANTVFAQNYSELYSATFTSVATHSYTQNKTFTLSDKSWTASVSQVNNGVFYLGCNSNNASKGVLGNNNTFASVNTALLDADDHYTSGTTHAYALLFENSYSNVTKVTFDWAGGNNAFQVYLFGDSGSGFVLLNKTDYATSGAAVAGSVEWTGSATNYTKFAIVARPGTTSSTATNKTLRASSFKIYETSGGGNPTTVATPVISGLDSFYPTTDVSISCETDGASIYYTIDGTSPTSSSNPYSSSFSINSTTTVKAIAIKDGMTDSEVASKLFTLVSPYSDIASLTEVTQAGDYYISFDNAVVSYVNGNYAYVQDATGAVAFYKKGHTLNAGDVLNGLATVSYQLRNNNPQITEISGVTPVSGLAPSPISVAADSWNYTFANVLSQYFQITGATITENGGKYYVSLNGDDVQLYKASGAISSLNLTRTYTITGFPTLYNTTKELQIFSDPEQEVSPDPVITVSSATLSGFTYEEGNGPSTARTITVSGSNLTANISLSLSGTDYEMSLSENTDYTNSLILVQSEGSVAATTVYVRLKFGLSVGSYSGSTITLASTGASNQTVDLSGSVTAAPVPASLPFSFNDGLASIESTDGLSQNGLGSDYNVNNTKLKFDNTGDYVILWFNARPGILTFDIKSNSFSGGTFTVEESADGSSYTTLQEYTSITNTQSEELTPASTTRYIRWIYTEKSSGNVGLGNISLSEYSAPVPAITVAPDAVNATTSETVGSLAITYSNIAIADESDFGIQFYDSEDNTISDPSWIVVSVDEDNGDYVVSYVIAANAAAPRTAYFKVFAMGPEDFVYSNKITASQAGIPTNYAVLPFIFNGGVSEIAETSGLSQEGLGTDYVGNAPKLKFDGTGDNVILRINETPGTLSFDIKGNSFSGGTFTVQASVNGIDYTDVASYTTLGDTQTETISDLAANVRFIKWIYTNKSAGNVGLGNISLARPAAVAETIELVATENGGRYWATFFSGSRYSLSGGVQAFTINSSKQLYLLGDDGSVIPANTAVVLISDSETITLTKSNASGEISVNGGANILVGSDSPVAKYSISGTPYVLGIKGGTLGFYEFTGSGIPANKAYYIVNE